MSRAKAIAERELKEEANADKPVLTLPPLPQTYDTTWLEAAREFENAHQGMVIVNPRNRFAAALIEFDWDWLQDMARWRQMVQFHKDYPKRDASMK